MMLSLISNVIPNELNFFVLYVWAKARFSSLFFNAINGVAIQYPFTCITESIPNKIDGKNIPDTKAATEIGFEYKSTGKSQPVPSTR